MNDGICKRALGGVLALGILVLGATGARAGAVIFNTGTAGSATVALGVNDHGQLNTLDPFGAVTTYNSSGYFGVASRMPDGSWGDATAPGCLCEGWGVSATSGGSAFAGYANEAGGGVVNLTLDGTTTDAVVGGVGSMFTSEVHLTSLTGLSVVQAYAPSAIVPGVLFEDKVTITNNTGAAISDLRYVRVMDWDVPPTMFDEFVTIVGTATTLDLETSHDNGFSSANPLAATSPLNPATLDVDFIDDGPADHGAYFRFNFGSLADGESKTFSVYYGAATGERAALAAIAAEGIELFSLGQQRDAPLTGTPLTFIFGFKGVGGVPFDVPEPGTFVLAGLGALGLGLGVLRRRRA